MNIKKVAKYLQAETKTVYVDYSGGKYHAEYDNGDETLRKSDFDRDVILKWINTIFKGSNKTVKIVFPGSHVMGFWKTKQF